MYTIYALQDPRTFRIRYVGLTNNMIVRFFSHIGGMEKSPKKNAWLKELKMLGEMPVVYPLDKANTLDEARAKEAYWINRYADKMPGLTNARFPVSTIPSLSLYNPALIELDMAIDDLEGIIDKISKVGFISHAGACKYPTEKQATLWLSVKHDGVLEYYTVRFFRRCLMDNSIACYRTKLPTCNWALFGDETFLTRRLLATHKANFDSSEYGEQRRRSHARFILNEYGYKLPAEEIYS